MQLVSASRSICECTEQHLTTLNPCHCHETVAAALVPSVRLSNRGAPVICGFVTKGIHLDFASGLRNHCIIVKELFFL